MGSWLGLPGLDDRSRGPNQMFDGLGQHLFELALGETLTWLTLGRSIVAVHVMLVEVIVDQANRRPPSLHLKLQQDGVVGRRTSADADQHTRIDPVKRYGELTVELHPCLPCQPRWAVCGRHQSSGAPLR